MSDVIAERRVAYPKQPWLWNPDWALGRVLPADRPGTIKFNLPEQLCESDRDVTSDGERCKWILVTTVKCADASFAGRFEVPVFNRETVARGRNGNVETMVSGAPTVDVGSR